MKKSHISLFYVSLGFLMIQSAAASHATLHRVSEDGIIATYLQDDRTLLKASVMYEQKRLDNFIQEYAHPSLYDIKQRAFESTSIRFLRQQPSLTLEQHSQLEREQNVLFKEIALWPCSARNLCERHQATITPAEARLFILVEMLTYITRGHRNPISRSLLTPDSYRLMPSSTTIPQVA